MIAIGSDHAGYDLKMAIISHLKERGEEFEDFGCDSNESVDYPKYGHAVGKAVASGEADRGIAICGTGIGISIAANKVPGVRAGVVHSVETAHWTKNHNDANVLCFGARVVGRGLAFELVDAFLETEFLGGRHQRRVDMIMEYEK